jgi:hypothetical protein
MSARKSARSLFLRLFKLIAIINHLG